MALEAYSYPWFALKVSNRSEPVAAKALRLRGFEIFSPVITERRLYADRFKNVDIPVFAGYVLIRWDGKSKNDILSAPAVQYLVSFGGSPAVIRDTEISDVRRTIENGGQPVPYLATGHRVRVETGALAGVEGIYVRRSRGQLVVSIELIERSIALHVDEDRVRPLGGMTNPISSNLLECSESPNVHGKGA
jgi:transcription antitermination factor NusG